MRKTLYLSLRGTLLLPQAKFLPLFKLPSYSFFSTCTLYFLRCMKHYRIQTRHKIPNDSCISSSIQKHRTCGEKARGKASRKLFIPLQPFELIHLSDAQIMPILVALLIQILPSPFIFLSFFQSWRRNTEHWRHKRSRLMRGTRLVAFEDVMCKLFFSQLCFCAP